MYQPPEKRPPGKRWSIWRAGLYGVIFSLLAMALNYENVSYMVQNWPAHLWMARLGGRLLGGAILFMIIAAIRNLIVMRRGKA